MEQRCGRCEAGIAGRAEGTERDRRLLERMGVETWTTFGISSSSARIIQLVGDRFPELDNVQQRFVLVHSLILARPPFRLQRRRGARKRANGAECTRTAMTMGDRRIRRWWALSGFGGEVATEERCKRVAELCHASQRVADEILFFIHGVWDQLQIATW